MSSILTGSLNPLVGSIVLTRCLDSLVGFRFRQHGHARSRFSFYYTALPRLSMGLQRSNAALTFLCAYVFSSPRSPLFSNHFPSYFECLCVHPYKLAHLLSMEPWAAAKKALSLCDGATSSCPGS